MNVKNDFSFIYIAYHFQNEISELPRVVSTSSESPAVGDRIFKIGADSLVDSLDAVVNRNN